MNTAIELKELRIKHGLTQAEVAGLAGIERTSLIRIEKDRGGSTTLRTLTLVAAALGYEVQIKFVRKL